MKPIACATTNVPAVGDSVSLVWGVVAVQNKNNYFDPALAIPADIVPCLMFNTINSSNTKYNAKFLDLMSTTNIQYVCDGQPLRVFTCLSNQDECLLASNKPSDLNIGTIWTIYEA